MKIKITKEQYEKARQFAEQRIGLSEDLYRRRGELKVNKMLEDIIIGTVGEYGAAKYIRSKLHNCSRPDLKIYKGRKKSFDADLIVKDVKTCDDDFKDKQKLNIHVKSQGVSSAKKYGNSWLLQKSDKITQEPSDYDYFVFTKVDGLEVEILGVVKCKDIIDNDLLDECKVPMFRHSKHALYFKDIEQKLTKRKIWSI